MQTGWRKRGSWSFSLDIGVSLTQSPLTSKKEKARVEKLPNFGSIHPSTTYVHSTYSTTFGVPSRRWSSCSRSRLKNNRRRFQNARLLLSLSTTCIYVHNIRENTLNNSLLLLLLLHKKLEICFSKLFWAEFFLLLRSKMKCVSWKYRNTARTKKSRNRLQSCVCLCLRDNNKPRSATECGRRNGVFSWEILDH